MKTLFATLLLTLTLLVPFKESKAAIALGGVAFPIVINGNGDRAICRQGTAH